MKQIKKTIRTETLEAANNMVNGHREQDYGTPENNFKQIADLWSAYLGFKVTALDVAMLMGLLKTARIKTGTATHDSFIDLAGYAACGAELAIGPAACSVGDTIGDIK